MVVLKFDHLTSVPTITISVYGIFEMSAILLQALKGTKLLSLKQIGLVCHTRKS